MTERPYYATIDGRPDFNTLYTRCPTCGTVAAPWSATYDLTEDHRVDPGALIELTCSLAGHTHRMSLLDVLPRDTTVTCARTGCGLPFDVPAIADQVVCPACQVHQRGPAVLGDPDRAAFVAEIHRRWIEAAHARLRARPTPLPRAADDD